MAQLTSKQARVVDPVLTAVATAFKQPASFVADVLFPLVGVDLRAGKIITFSPDDFELLNTVRAPGTNIKMVQFGRASADYVLADYQLDGAVPKEILQEAANGPGVDEASRALTGVQRIMALERENEAAVKARNAASYPATNKAALSGASQWSNSASNPFVDVETAKEAIRKQVGMRPNVMVVPSAVLSALRVHDKVLNRLSTSTDRTPATIAQLQALFEIEIILEAGAIYKDASGAMADVWGKDVVFAYVDRTSAQDNGSPAYGYTYNLNGYPSAEEAWLDKTNGTWRFPMTHARGVFLVGPTSGYLLQNAVA